MPEPSVTRAGQEVYRVRDLSTGHEYTIGAEFVTEDPRAVEVLDKPAVDPVGIPLPPKYRWPEPHTPTSSINEEGTQQ